MAEEVTGANVAGSAAPQETAPAEATSTETTQVAEGSTAGAQQTQTQDDNARFAAARRESETKLTQYQQKVGHDTEIVRKYGGQYGCFTDSDVEARYGAQGLHTLEDLEAEAQRAEYQQQTGVDPNALKSLFEKWKESDPDFQAVRKQQHDNRLVTEYYSLLSSLDGVGLKGAVKEPKDIPPAVFEKWNDGKGGLSLADAYFLVNRSQILSKSTASAQQNAVTQILSNGQSSPGPLAGGGGETSKGVWDMSATDFKKMQEKALSGELKKG